MKRIFVNNKISPKYFNAVLLILLTAFTHFAQNPTSNDKKEKAEKIFAEAKELANQETTELRQSAIQKFEEARKLYREIDDKEDEAYCLLWLGKTYFALGKNQKALEYYIQSLPLMKEVKDKGVEASTFSMIGLIYNELGENQKALDYFNQALPLLRSVEDKSGEATTLTYIGIVYEYLGETKTALDYFIQALPLSKAIGNKSGEAAALTNIGGIYDDLGEEQKALDYYNQSLALIRIVGDKHLESEIINNIGSINLHLGENQKALDYYNQSLNLSRLIKDKDRESTSLNNIGRVYVDLGENQKALEYLNQSLILLREIGDKSRIATSLSNIMFAWNHSGNRKLAIFYGKQSVNVYQQLRANIKGLDKSVQQTFLKTIETTYRDLANILIADSRLPEAQAILDLLKEQEFSGLINRGGEIPENVPYSKAEDTAIKVLDQIAALGREKGELAEKNEKGTLNETERQRFKDLEKQIEITEAEFNKSLAALSAETNKGQNVEAVDKDAQSFMSTLQELGRGTVALYTVIVNDDKIKDNPNDKTKSQIKTGWIILVTPEFRKAYPIDVKDLEQTIFNFRQTLTSPIYNPLPFAQSLYKKMFLQTSEKQKTTLATDLDEYFKDKPNKTLMWSLDGIFRYVPIAALHDGKQYLVEKYRNTIFNTASKDRLKDTVKPNWTALGLGVSLGRTESGKTFSPLEGAKKELQKIVKQDNNAGIMKGSIKMDDQFTQDAMFDALSFDKNPLVHIASHFSYQIADFDSSFLLLGNGKLTVKDLRVKSQLFNGVDLLTLSACETAVPDANGKDVEGFAYLAQSLGAKAIMATLWQVDDIGTQIFMPEFYRLHETGLNKAEALRKAQLALLQGKIKDVPADVKRAELRGNSDGKIQLEKYDGKGNPPFAHPYYWSPFVLIGNWK